MQLEELEARLDEQSSSEQPGQRPEVTSRVAVLVPQVLRVPQQEQVAESLVWVPERELAQVAWVPGC